MEKVENRKTFVRANGTSRRASGWAGEKVARSGRSIRSASWWEKASWQACVCYVAWAHFFPL